MNPVFQPLGRYVLIGHLRGFAALAVTLFHSFGTFENQRLWAPLEPLERLAAHGWLGVHVFFVISGYCLAEKISSLAAQGRGSGAFLADRFWRIMPPYWAALALSLGIGLAALPFNHTGLDNLLPGGAGGLVANLLLLPPPFEYPSLLLVGWTLVCEAGFYLILAVLLLGWPRVGGFGGVYSLATLLTIACVIPGSGFTGVVFAYWPEFWLGLTAYAALASRQSAAGLALLAVFGGLAWWQPAGAMDQIHLTAVLTAGLLVALHRWDGHYSGIRWLRWLGVVGLWSYSLYLVHVPLLSRTQNLAGRWVRPDSAAFGLVWLASVALALAGAWIFYRLVEAPLENWRHGRARRPTIISVAAASSTSIR